MKCNEMYYFAAILRLLEASQTIADCRRCLPENRSSVASQLGAINCFLFPPAIFIAVITYRII